MMAGQPKRRELERQLDDEGRAEEVWERIGNGETLREIATTFNCSRWMLQRWIHAEPERERHYQEAKREGASAMVEEGKTLLDEADEHSSGAVQKARFQADYRKWYAGIIDRQTFGPPEKRLQISGDIGHWHLEALKAYGTTDSLPIPDGDAEVLKLEAGDDPAETG